MVSQVKFINTFAPFKRSFITLPLINFLLVFLLIPAFIQSVYFYGFYSLRVICSSVVAAVFWDYFFKRVFNRKIDVYNGDSVVIGLILGMLFPPTVPFWIILWALFTAIFLGRALFGGTGCGPFNPVCIGWAFVMISWKDYVDPAWGSVAFNLPFNVKFPLAEWKMKGIEAISQFSIKELFLGKQAGCCGATSQLLILMGGIGGVLLKITPVEIPISFLGGIIITSLSLVISGSLPSHGIFFHLFSGFSFIGAFFIATEWSRPVSRWVRIYYGLFCGILTVLLRMWSNFSEALPFAILIVNITISFLDRGRAVKHKTVEVVEL